MSGDLEGALRAAGFAVDRVVLYAAEPVTTLPEAAAAALAEGEAAMGCCSIRRGRRNLGPAGDGGGAWRGSGEAASSLPVTECGGAGPAALPGAPVPVADQPDEDAMVALALAVAAAER